MVEKNQVNICSQIESIPLICSMSVNPCHLVLIYCTRKSAASSSDILVHACLFTRRCMFRQTRAHSSQNLDKDQLKTAGCLTSVKIVIAASSFVVLVRFARCGNNEVKNKRTEEPFTHMSIMISCGMLIVMKLKQAPNKIMSLDPYKAQTTVQGIIFTLGNISNP